MYSTGAAEEDHFPEALVSGQTIHTVWTAGIGYSLHHLCYRRSLDGGATWQDRVILQDYDADSDSLLRSGEITRLTITSRLAKPVPADLDITAEFTTDLMTPPWMFTGIVGTDVDLGDHIDRTFRAPFASATQPAGFMRLRVRPASSAPAAGR